MNELTLHPNVYATGPSKGLVPILERVWVREQPRGDGTMFIVSGFANYNGGVRFFPTFRDHIAQGGKVVAVFSGSTRMNLTSKQVVSELLSCGAEVHVINRKRLMHAKSYGSKTRDGRQMLVVTSGNFTGPGMAQNVEMALLLDRPTTHGLGFSWDEMIGSMLAQRWDLHRPDLANMAAPAWSLLYDEEASTIRLDETDEVTMILRLGHADTVRIMAEPGTVEGRGSQYFWLSRDCYDFFPALTILNVRGVKRTYSCDVQANFIDLGQEHTIRVTFEAENNLDFRFGTGPLRYTKLARVGDIAAISRVGESRYELRIYKQGSSTYRALAPNAINFIGHQGKQYGFMPNQDFQEAIGVRLGRRLHS